MKRFSSNGHIAVWIALTLLIVFGVMRYDNFASSYNLSSFLGYNPMFVLISVGMCLVIMTGGIDLCVGTVAARWPASSPRRCRHTASSWRCPQDLPRPWRPGGWTQPW